MMNEDTVLELDKFLSKLIFEVAYKPTRDEALRLLNKIREEKKGAQNG